MIDQCLDVKVHHDLVEIKMMEVFHEVDSKSFGSCAFTLIIIEVPGSKFQPTPFSYAFPNKYIKAYFIIGDFTVSSTGMLTLLIFPFGLII